MQFLCVAVVLLLAAHLAPAIDAWGYVGHQLTAAIALKFLEPKTAHALDELLPGGQTIVRVATWADEIKRQPRYAWSSTLHYTNPKDDEPATCGYDYQRDCPSERCVVGAIYNFTAVLDASVSPNRPRADRAEALKFLVHFLGDIHQPLHVSGRGKGGNTAKVRFDGALQNLHAVWDFSMLEKRMTADFGGNFRTYTDHLLGRLESEWGVERNEWLQCQRHPRFRGLVLQQSQADASTTSDPRVTSGSGKESCCPDLWAIQINKFDCSHVWKGIDVMDESAASELQQQNQLEQQQQDLGGAYYKQNIPLVEKLLVEDLLVYRELFRMQLCQQFYESW